MKRLPRLKKGPAIQDFVVEVITRDKVASSFSYKYFDLRKEARDYAKDMRTPRTRVRVFRIKYSLVADLK